MNFAECLKNEANWNKTENGMDALRSTNSSILDFFGNILSFRKKSVEETTQAFNKAYNEDSTLAMKLLFYLRNIRGLGQGERQTFRTIVRYMAFEHPEVMRSNLENISIFGRFDDYYAFVGTPLENDAFEILKNAVKHDLEEKNDTKLTLVGKWLKSTNTSSKESVRLGRLTATKFGFSESNYRKLLSTLRKRIDIVEAKMSGKRFDEVDYSKVPSKAMMIYRKAFEKNDGTRFDDYIEKVKNGSTKINSKALYPYEIMHKMGLDTGYSFVRIHYDDVLQAQWDALPDYIGKASDTIAVVDTSSSMNGTPFEIAMSLGVYLAERNQGVWKNKMITFSSKPQYIELTGKTLTQKLNGIKNICQNTNIHGVFELILNTAINNDLKDEDLIKRIVIISDMQFDGAIYHDSNNRQTLTEEMKKKFAEHGYTLPEVVYWNASPNYSETYHGRKNDYGIKIVSGASPSLFMSVLKDEFKTPYEVMLETLNDKIFDCVKGE